MSSKKAETVTTYLTHTGDDGSDPCIGIRVDGKFLCYAPLGTSQAAAEAKAARILAAMKEA